MKPQYGTNLLITDTVNHDYNLRFPHSFSKIGHRSPRSVQQILKKITLKMYKLDPDPCLKKNIFNIEKFFKKKKRNKKHVFFVFFYEMMF